MKKKLEKIRKGTYLPEYIISPYCIASNSVENGCISYHSALAFHGFATQGFNWIYVHSSRQFSDFEKDHVKYVFAPVRFLLNPQFYPGEWNYEIKVTSLSQTVIDCIGNIGMAGGIEELLNALYMMNPGNLNPDEMMSCLSRYSNKRLYQRAGYFLSLFKEYNGLPDTFFEFCKEQAGNATIMLSEEKGTDFEHNREWNLIVPKNILKQIKKGTL